MKLIEFGFEFVVYLRICPVRILNVFFWKPQDVGKLVFEFDFHNFAGLFLRLLI